jgi:hypothetical protein
MLLELGGSKIMSIGPKCWDFLQDLVLVVGTWNSRVQWCHCSQALTFSWSLEASMSSWISIKTLDVRWS